MTTPQEMFVAMIEKQVIKEAEHNIWKTSIFKDLVKLQSNNVGIVGESFIQMLCDAALIDASVDGTKTKQLGGGCGDGFIMGKTVEIKTSHQGTSCANFQHELGEFPWKSEYMVFIDVSPDCIYLTLFKNFKESTYKEKVKCAPLFPTKSVTWRKKKGAFKFDTSVKINETNVVRKMALKITESIQISDVKEYIDRIISP